jgi:MFS family permease
MYERPFLHNARMPEDARRLAKLWTAASRFPREAFGQYASVLQVPGVLALLVFASVARLTVGMAGLAIVLRFSNGHAGYGHAGAVTAAFVGGLALGSPVYVRLLARTTYPRLLLAAGSIASSTGILVLSLSWRTQISVTVTVALLAGLTAPPVSSLMRSLWPRVVRPPLQPAVYSLDATLVEAAFIAGPAIVGLTSWLLGTQVSLAICGIPGLVGVLLLVSHPVIKEAAQAPPVPTARARQRLLSPTFTPILLVLLLAAFSFGLVEIAVVAEIAGGRSTSLAGLVFAIAGLGSVVGGLSLGPAVIAGGYRSLALVLLILSAVVAVLQAMHSPSTITMTLAAANMLLTPAVGSVYVTVVTNFPDLDKLTAFGWMFSSQLAAIAAGNMIAGMIIDRSGAAPAFLLASGCVLVAALQIGVAGRRRA